MALRRLLPLIALLAAAAVHAAEPTVDLVVVRADTLIGLSNTVLVSTKAWREVARLNRLPDPNRIVPGQVLKIPARLLRSVPVDARLVSAVGDVRVGDTAAAEDAALAEGQAVLTGASSSAVIELADGSRLRLPPSSLAQAVASGRSPGLVKLPAAPDLSSLPERFERPLVRFALPTEGVPLRVQVASDSAFDKIVSDQRIDAGAEARIAGLDDAPWFLRARRIDAGSIEGFDASRAFVLKARPEPPVYRAPRSDAKQPVGSVEFVWALNIAAPQVRLQIAEDAAFTKLVEDRDTVAGSALRAGIAAPGNYFWRVASVRADGDRGPFGDAQRFEIRPLPEPPTAGLAGDGRSLVFKWGGRA